MNETGEQPMRGRCLCGDVTFAFTGAPRWVVYCHCDSCRRATSSPTTVFVGVALKNFRYTGKSPQRYDSSPGVTRSFCARCGTPMAFEADRYPGEIHVYAASLEDPNALAPRGHVHVDEQLDWFEVLDELPRFAATGAEGEPLYRGPRQV